MEETIVLAFDIERTGPKIKHDTIGIGMSVVNSKFEELDSLFLNSYIEGEVKFNKRCYNEFWSKHLDSLEKMKYSGEKSFQERQKEIITEFQNFRKKWEQYSEDNGLKFELVSDNNVFDGGFINELIYKYLPNDLPIPYNAGNKQYSCFWETYSQQRSLLFMVDPDFKSNWGFPQRIAEIYELPKPLRLHDHNPVNDAYTIAYDQQVLLGIKNNTIKKKYK